MKDELQVLVEAGKRIERRERFALVTLIRSGGSTPRKEGARMLVSPAGKVFGTVGGAAVERIAAEHALKSLVSGKVECLSLDLDDSEHMQTGMVCGGNVELLIEPIGAGPRLLLFGAGHVAQPTAQLASEIGYEVTVYDERSDWANRERFPHANIVVGEIEKLAEECESTTDDFYAVMTYCHDEDMKVVKKLLRKPYYYLGVIGSRRKAVEIRENLGKAGFVKTEIDRMTCPIGMNIGSHTPIEVAIAINAQLIELRNKWEKERKEPSDQVIR